MVRELKAELKSAKELSGDEISKITDELTKNFSSKIKLNYKHDESLIGGLIVQVGSTMVDTSIKNKFGISRWIKLFVQSFICIVLLTVDGRIRCFGI